MEKQLTVVLADPHLETQPVDRQAPLVLRIAHTRPHGSQTWYDFRYIGLVPGTYDLRDFLIRPDGSPLGDLPPLEVSVEGLLPETHNGWLHEERRALGRGPWPYQLKMLVAGALWLFLGLVLSLLFRRRKPREKLPPPRTPGWDERLRPLVEKAIQGRLDADDQARLERLLIGFWEDRLNLRDLSLTEALARLREHTEAGQILTAMEDWLHRRPGSKEVDLEWVLEPYRNVSVEETAPLRPPTPEVYR